MIATLLRHDASFRTHRWLLPGAALFVALLVRLFGDVMSRVDATGAADAFRPLEWLVAGQLLVLYVFCGVSMSMKHDAAGVMDRCRRLDLALPLRPRDLWTARLLARLSLVAAPGALAAVTLVLWRPSPDWGFLLHVAGLGSAWILAWSAARPGRARPIETVAHRVLLVASLVAAGALLSWREPLVTGGVLMLAAVAALRAVSRLPATWTLDGDRTKVPPSRPEPPREAGGLPADRRRRPWAVVARTAIGPPIVATLAAIAFLSILWPLTESSLAFTCWMAGLLASITVSARQQVRFLAALPLRRRVVLAWAMAPAALALLGSAGLSWLHQTQRHPYRPDVTLDTEYGERTTGGDRPYRSWVEVQVPAALWEIGTSAPPRLTAPHGESHRPPASRALGLPGTFLYNPYHAPPDASPAFVAWQFSRALEAWYGVRVPHEELHERYLERDPSGGASIAQAQVRRNLEVREREGDPWYGTLGTLLRDLPQLRAARTHRIAAPVLLLVLAAWTVLAVLSLVGPRVGWPGRSRPRATVRLGQILGAAVMVFALAADEALRRMDGGSTLHVLFARAVRALDGLLPESPAVTALVLVAWGAVCFRLVAAAFERCELIPAPVPRAFGRS